MFEKTISSAILLILKSLQFCFENDNAAGDVALNFPGIEQSAKLSRHLHLISIRFQPMELLIGAKISTNLPEKIWQNIYLIGKQPEFNLCITSPPNFHQITMRVLEHTYITRVTLQRYGSTRSQ